MLGVGEGKREREREARGSSLFMSMFSIFPQRTRKLSARKPNPLLRP